MRLRHYYHVYTGAPGWEAIVDEHLDVLAHNDLCYETDAVRLGVVGPDGSMDEVARRFLDKGVPVTVVAKELAGWEQVTLKVLYDELEDDTAVLYTHTKGATSPSDLHTAWRRSMTKLLVEEWFTCKQMLERVEVVGCHWLTPERFADVGTPYFGGNFWWARADYLRTLAPPGEESRHAAEAWVGSGPPKMVADRSPGWPGWASFK